MTALEVTQTVNDPPAFGEIREGWYQVDNEWWLTHDAVLKEFNLTNKQFSDISLALHNLKNVNYGKLRTIVRFNPYNNKGFILYSLDDMQMLKQEGLLQTEKVTL